MFFNIYRKYILCSLRNKDMVIWTFLFPILLATIFHFSFMSIDSAEAMKEIEVAVVKDGESGEEPYFSMMLEELSKGKNPVLHIRNVSQEKAEGLLKDGKVQGYMKIEKGNPVLFVKDHGMDQTILKNILDCYIQISESVKNSFSEELPKKQDFFIKEESVEEITFSGNPPSYTINYFYALLAMTCFFGAFQGLSVINCMQANLSPLGARNTVSPGNRGMIFRASFLASLTVLVICVMAAFLYMQFVLGVNFGGKFIFVFLNCILGSGVGITFGCLVSLPSKWKNSMKTAIVVSTTLICCYFAGLMVEGVNYWVQKHMPILSALNPAARIADGFYCLYYYDNYVRYFQNMGILAVMFAGMLLTAFIGARRKVYESL